MRNFSKSKRITALSIIIFCCFLGCNYYVNAEDTSNYVYLGGDAFGLKMFTKGCMVINLESFKSDNGNVNPAKESGLKINDNIIYVEDVKIDNNETLEDVIENCDGEDLDFVVERNHETIEFEITPIKDESGEYKIGAWIRDSCSGIGTISYYDENTGIYAGLGHGICDIDTGELINLDNGNICKATITGVTKATEGVAGTLNGFLNNNEIGSLSINSNYGVYGEYKDLNSNRKIEVADIDEVKTGTAYVYSTINSDGIQKFEANIESICNTDCNNNKNFVIEITDKRLLSVTGGIVQGMSGSPVVQNSKLVGVINHVFVNSPEKGYCIFAQNMVSNFDNYPNI